MPKSLPINLNVDVQINCFDFYRLSAILSNERYIPWYIERFIEMHMDELFRCHYYDFKSDFLFLYDEILEFNNITPKDSIVDQIRESIDKNEYLILRINEGLISDTTSEFQLHGKLIVGYDEDEVFFLNHNGIRWSVSSVKTSVFESAFQSSMNLIRDGVMDFEGPGSLKEHFNLNEPASTFRIHNIDFNRKPRLNVIFNMCSNFLNGGERKSKFGPNIAVWYGTSIYRGYYQHLCDYLLENPEITYNGESLAPKVYLGMKRLSENKRGLLNKLIYLKERKIVDVGESVFERFCCLYKEIDVSSSLWQKYWLTKNQDYVDSMKDRLKNSEELDKSALTDVCNIMYKVMRSSL